MSPIFYGSSYAYLSPEPPSSGYEENPAITGHYVGFRLAYDGECRPFVGCVNACKAPVRRFGTFQERGDWSAHGVGFRLAWERE